MRVLRLTACILCSYLFLASSVNASATIELVRQSRFVAGAVQTGFWINGVFIGAMKSGRMRIEVPPGNNRLEASNALPCDSLFASGDCDVNPFPDDRYSLPLVVAEGETAIVEAYMGDGDPWIIFRRLDAEQPSWLRKLDVVMPEIAVVTDHYITPAEHSMAELCLNAETLDACEPYMATYPEGAYVAQVASILGRLAEEETRKRALLEALPADVRLDALLVKIEQAVKEERFDEAVTLYEQVDELPISAPRDLLFDWAETLIAMNDRAGGLEKLYRYVSSQGRSANRYQDALLLMNEIELNLQ